MKPEEQERTGRRVQVVRTRPTPYENTYCYGDAITGRPIIQADIMDVPRNDAEREWLNHYLPCYIGPGGSINVCYETTTEEAEVEDDDPCCEECVAWRTAESAEAPDREELAQIIMSPESFDGGPASCGPNDVYAARIADAILVAGYSKHSEELGKYKRGAKTLGEIIEKQCRDVLDVTGLHHLINEDGDGHWDVVWMRLFEMREELASLKESTIARERQRGDAWRDRAQEMDSRAQTLEVELRVALERATPMDRPGREGTHGTA